jgi:hypothetical protein
MVADVGCVGGALSESRSLSLVVVRVEGGGGVSRRRLTVLVVLYNPPRSGVHREHVVGVWLSFGKSRVCDEVDRKGNFCVT